MSETTEEDPRSLYDLSEAMNPVTFYEDYYYMFSSFSAFAIKEPHSGKIWMTAEHRYQAMKFATDKKGASIVFSIIFEALSAHDAKKNAHANSNLRRPDWSEVKVQIMTETVQLKIEQHEYVRSKLLETGGRPIVENSPTDSFWGCGEDRKGRNELGKIWMRERRRLQAMM